MEKSIRHAFFLKPVCANLGIDFFFLATVGFKNTL